MTLHLGTIILVIMGAMLIIPLIIIVFRQINKDRSYPQLDDWDRFKIGNNAHFMYFMDWRTGRIRLRWEERTYLLPGGGYAKDHYPLTDDEYEKRQLAEAEQRRQEAERLRQEVAKRQQKEKEAQYAQLVEARAAGHDVCFDCGTIDPPRCRDCGTQCLNCDPASCEGWCYLCDSD
jgi:hypothetical protein